MSAVGVASGVALATAVFALSSSIDASLEGVASTVASRANIEARALTRAGIPAPVVADIRAIPGVRAAGATVESHTQVKSGRRVQRTLLLGVDPGMVQLGARSFDASTLREADLSGVFLPSSLARDLSVTKGDVIEFATPTGWRDVPVGLVLGDDVSGASRAAVAAIGVVQDLLGKAGMVDAVYIEATDSEAVLPELRRAVGDRAQIGPLALRKQEVREMVSAAVTILGAGSILALFVGAFLVYNTMTMAAVERSQEAAVLRAVGASRRQVLLLFLFEGCVLGLVGSGIGLGLGTLLATLLVGRGSALEEVYPIEFTRLVVQPSDVALVAVVGVAAAIAATVLPARRVSRVDPVAVLGQSGALEDPTRRPRLATLFAAISLLILGGSLASAFVTSRALGSLGYIAFLVGMALLIPWLVPALARSFVWSLHRSTGGRRGILRLAAAEIVRAPSRTSLTAGAVLLSLSIVVALAIGYASFFRTFRADIDEWARADLYVSSATWRPYGSDVPLDNSLAEELREVPGVVAVYSYRITTVSISGHAVLVEGSDGRNWSQLPDLSPPVRRRMEGVAKTLGEPGAMIITRSAANLLRLEVGDVVELPTPSGTVRKRVVEIRSDVSDVSPQFTLGFEELSRLWGSSLADSFGIGVAPGKSVSGVRREIVDRFGSNLGIVVETREEFIRQINSLANAVFGLLSSVQLVAVVVASLGLANTLLMSTIERRRELGVMRAVGMLRRQVRRMVTAEALMVAGIGIILAWLVGTAIGIWVYVALKVSLGEMQLALPASGYVAAALLGLTGSGLAAALPAYRAARMDVIDALHYE